VKIMVKNLQSESEKRGRERETERVIGREG